MLQLHYPLRIISAYKWTKLLCRGLLWCARRAVWGWWKCGGGVYKLYRRDRLIRECNVLLTIDFVSVQLQIVARFFSVPTQSKLVNEVLPRECEKKCVNCKQLMNTSLMISLDGEGRPKICPP